MAASFIAPPIWMMFLLGGLGGLPLSVPPQEEDPALARIAPQKCLWYMSAAGMADPDPNSSNHTEQLLADPQIQKLAAEIEAQIIRLARRESSGPEERVLAAELPDLIKIALTHPLAAYVADVQPPSAGAPPKINAGIVVKVGDRADAVERSIERLVALAQNDGSSPAADNRDSSWRTLPLPPDAPPVQWGTREGYLIVGIGAGEADRIAEQLTSAGGPPDWLESLKDELPVERRSTTGYLNVAGILERVRPLIGPQEANFPQYLGIENVQALYTASGMDDVACVSKGLIALDGQPRGALELLPQKPLAKNDLQLIPPDATVAFALRLDARDTLDRFINLVERFEPRARAEFEDGLWQAESELGIDIRRDILDSLDDTLVVYMPGGEVFTAWTGTSGAIKIKDRRRLERAIDKLAVVARLELEPREGGQQGARLRESEFEDYTVHYVQFVGQPVPFTPSWCVTDELLVFGLTPQSVKTAIGRYGKGGESLGDDDRVAEALGRDAGPAMLTYVDTQRLFRGFYPMLMWGLQAASGELAREGFEFDMALIPSSEAIAPHLVPTISTWSHTPEGFRFEAHQSLPGGDFVSTAPIGIALLLPAVQSARHAARTTQEINSLRQLALAFHNYTDVHNEFPSNIYDENGKPLLSWRVQLLPYIEKNQLYEQFHLDEPWDSPHNKQLIDQMPDVFKSPTSVVPAGQTRFVAMAHEKSLFPGNKKLHFRDVVDGTSNTIMFVQAAPQNAVEWSRPEDLSFDPQNPKAGLAQADGKFLAAFADGSVQRIFIGASDEAIRRIVFRNDGEVVDREELLEGTHR